MTGARILCYLARPARQHGESNPAPFSNSNIVQDN
jgi:hypothetical protein